MPAYNTFSSLQPNFKETYSDSKKKPFSKLRHSLKKGIGLSMERASRDPKSYLNNQNMSIKGLKGLVV